jgi:hypothetical protein
MNSFRERQKYKIKANEEMRRSKEVENDNVMM